MGTGSYQVFRWWVVHRYPNHSHQPSLILTKSSALDSISRTNQTLVITVVSPFLLKRIRSSKLWSTDLFTFIFSIALCDGSWIWSAIWDAVRRIAAEEGIRGFFRGFVPNLMRVTPASAITFFVYETVIRLSSPSPSFSSPSSPSPNNVSRWESFWYQKPISLTEWDPLIDPHFLHSSQEEGEKINTNPKVGFPKVGFPNVFTSSLVVSLNSVCWIPLWSSLEVCSVTLLYQLGQQLSELKNVVWATFLGQLTWLHLHNRELPEECDEHRIFFCNRNIVVPLRLQVDDRDQRSTFPRPCWNRDWN